LAYSLLVVSLYLLTLGTSDGKSSGNVYNFPAFNFPPNCVNSDTCKYQFFYSYDKASDVVTFSLAQERTPKTSICMFAFSKHSDMSSADVYLGYIDSTGEGVVKNGHMKSGSSKIEIDDHQGLLFTKLSYNDEYLFLTVKRSARSKNSFDVSFGNNDCNYHFYPVHGDDYTGGEFTWPKTKTEVSPSPICVGDQNPDASSFPPAADGPPLECKTTPAGADYRGTMSTTVSGKKCQAWSSDEPHAKMTFLAFPDGDEEAAKNYCRSPDYDSNGPWCFTTDENTEWESCPVKLCT